MCRNPGRQNPALAAFYFVSSFMAASMRVHDIGWDPIIVMSGWFTVLVIDGLIARRCPAGHWVPSTTARSSER